MMRSKVIKKGISRCQIKGQRWNYYFFFPQVSVHSSEPSPQSWNVAINTHHPPSLNQHCHHHHRHHHHHHADLLCVACPPLRHTSASLARKLPCSAFRCCNFFLYFCLISIFSFVFLHICVIQVPGMNNILNWMVFKRFSMFDSKSIKHLLKPAWLTTQEQKANRIVHHCLQKERIPFLWSVRKQNYTLVFSHI